GLPTGALDLWSLDALLRAYGLPVADQVLCSDREAARAAAAKLGYPVVLKAVGRDIVHKSDAGGVTLNLASAHELTAAIETMRGRIPALEGFLVQRMESGEAEVILGVTVDDQFGPQIVVGAGGILVELVSDVAIAPVPVSSANAH